MLDDQPELREKFEALGVDGVREQIELNKYRDAKLLAARFWLAENERLAHEERHEKAERRASTALRIAALAAFFSAVSALSSCVGIFIKGQ